MYGLAGAARLCVDPGAVVRPLPGLPAGRQSSCCRWCWPDRRLVDRAAAGPAGRSSADLYWPVVLVGTVCFLATLYHLSVPVRTRWRADLPGAALTLLMWLGGSALLRLVLGLSAGSTTIYGPLAAPIAVLIWLYLISSLAVLVGAAFNAAVDEVWPRLSEHRPHRHVSISGHDSQRCENRI